MKILVIDDSATMRKIVRNVLESIGYSPASILEATDGMDAIRMLRAPQFNVDIVLADWNMPNMDGLSLLKELHTVHKGQVPQSGPCRTWEELRSIPFIMMAGERERDRVAEAIRAGASDYVVKPFAPETLREKVLTIERELLDRRKTKPTDTQAIRFEAPKERERQDSDLPFLAQLPEEIIASIYRSASRSEHEEGEVLVRPADIVQSLHIVVRGEVEILPSGDGRVGETFGRGECFGELSFLSGDPAGLGARARTEVVVASVERGDFEDLLAEYPKLSLYLTRLVAKRARKADVKLASELEKGLSGRLGTISLAELVQTLHNSSKTGLLRVESGGEAGEIYFVDGNVRHARIGGRAGEEAFYALLTWTEGSFTFQTGATRIEHCTFRSTIGLLMEGMCRKDELSRMRA